MHLHDVAQRLPLQRDAYTLIPQYFPRHAGAHLNEVVQRLPLQRDARHQPRVHHQHAMGVK